MGLGDKLKGNLEPWLCYYCGECSEECPREAEPGETMMAMRRWLTAKYDFTGISKLFYENWAAEIGGIILLAVLTGVGFYWFGMAKGGGDFSIYAGPNAFLPAYTEGNFFGLGWNVHTFDWIMGGVLGGLLVINCLRMWWFTTGSRKDMKVPLGTYIKHAFLLPWHFITQKRYSECDKKRPWVIHLILMLSYLTLLVLIMLFLHHMHAPETHWIHIFGYASTIGLLGTRLRPQRPLNKTETHYKYSTSRHDLPVTAALLVHDGILRIRVRSSERTLANFMYIIHMMGVVPMLGLEVPFSKWAHLAYRPYAMYLAAVQADVIAEREGAKAPALVPQKQMTA
jgi:ferredoxin